ncbi:MAG: hypothetical protein MHMPM18_002666 [Marteilia pararefringens]
MTKGRQSGRRISDSDFLYGNSKSRGTLVAIPSDCPYPMSEPVDARSGVIIEDSSDSEGDLLQDQVLPNQQGEGQGIPQTHRSLNEISTYCNNILSPIKYQGCDTYFK